MTRKTIVLQFVERALVGVGAALALWCAFTIGQAAYFGALPVPAPGTDVARTMLAAFTAPLTLTTPT